MHGTTGSVRWVRKLVVPHEMNLTERYESVFLDGTIPVTSKMLQIEMETGCPSVIIYHENFEESFDVWLARETSQNV